MLSRSTARLLLPIILLSLSVIANFARAETEVIPAAPTLSAKAYVLMDAKSGKIIVEHNADERLPPASLTKLMTSYVLSHEVASGRVKNEDLATITTNAYAQNPAFQGSSLMFIEVGQQVSLLDLHRGIVISSGNDASVAVAEHLAGSENAFADLMNKHAERIGMKNTFFKNSHGLDAEAHYTTARDLALLTQAIINDFPEDYKMYSEKSFVFTGITQTNRNGLLFSDPSFDGLKTGFTEGAGYCLVASAEKDGMRLISVVLGTASVPIREQETQMLATYGFRFYETFQQVKAGEELARARVWSGVSDSLALVADKDVYLTLPRGRREQLVMQTQLDETIKAPIVAGQAFGELVISLDGEAILQQPLVANQAIEEAGFLTRLWHSIVLFFKMIFGG